MEQPCNARHNRDWCDIDGPNSVFAQNDLRRSGPLRLPVSGAPSGLPVLTRRRPGVRHSCLRRPEEEERPAPGLSTWIGERANQIRWQRAEEAGERKMLRRIQKRSGKASKAGEKSTQKKTDLLGALRRGKYLQFPRAIDLSQHDQLTVWIGGTSKSEDGNDKVRDKEEEEELNAKMGSMSLCESDISMGDMPDSLSSHLAPVSELEEAMGDMSICDPDTLMGGDR